MNKLTNNFLNELFKSCISSKYFMETICEHLKYEYLPNESYKKILKRMIQVFSLEKTLPTIGSLSQHFSNDEDIATILIGINNANIIDKKDSLLKEFEEYIKKSRFVTLYNKIGLIYNKGEHHKAIAALSKESQHIGDFSLIGKEYESIFEGYNDRQISRIKRKEDFRLNKIPFGIHELDHYTRGGMQYGTSVLLCARSGRGKSTMMRWIGLNAANMGLHVVHFQFEGTETEAADLYDSAWTGTESHLMEQGMIEDDRRDSIKKALNNVIRGGGEIRIVKYTSFDSFTIADGRNIVYDIEKAHGKVNLVIFDYLDLIQPGNGSNFSEDKERFRRLHVMNKITDIAKEMNCVCVTATQANNVRPEQYNNPNWKMTRDNISEAKMVLSPVSYFVTINQTDDEKENQIIRLFCDKFRKEKDGQTIYLYQNLKIGRFYDAKKTCRIFWDNNNNEKIYIEENAV